MKALAFIVGAVALSIAFNSFWAQTHDVALAKSVDAYTACVTRHFGQSPAAYFAEHGNYPTCGD